ncbi:PQQ-binding-like beta-propeller repeat protein [Haladaptatus sp. DJG-WS-42]|uniref:PQQ-binding-like beta-propeller repeat protein n=1 Tax=Haladaptatus sp. DJG-WS-42 TaxID=3120516 RepID=UPI0030CBEF62
MFTSVSGCLDTQPQTTLTETSTTTETTTKEARTNPPSSKCDRTWEPTVRWQKNIGNDADDLRIVNDVLYASVSQGIVAYNFDGTPKQHLQIEDANTDVVAATDRRVLLAGIETVRAINAATGSTDWRFEAEENASVSDVAVADGQVYVVTSKYPTASENFEETFVRLDALDATSGESLWQYDDVPGEGEFGWTVSADGDAVYVAWEDGVLLSVTMSGNERWRRTLPVDDVNLNVRFGGVQDGTLYLGVEGTSETALALSTADGTTLWEQSGLESVDGIADGRVYCSGRSAANGYRFAALAAETGEYVWSREFETGTVTTPAEVADSVLYAGVNNGQTDGSRGVWALDAASGCLLGEFSLDGRSISRPVVARNTVFVLDEIGEMYALTTVAE